ncbi:flagellar biosynthesis anti-sigma factor FlgM [Oceanobacillus massiliensis]|uniref:flagellar biosynthesis anti-sigma factor FlgM n=1 Tax=Oceanobacillus massiliensis TaxID=1465765 RepID=UPI0002894FD3|nr:flagellar biosynthesis anti-sigma factor FlgM [Oceanobacillus massiliensis]
MKINGPAHTNFNPYKQQIQKQTEVKKDIQTKDQIEISNQAKQLQENGKASEKRAAYFQEIKQAVDSGEYKVNPEKTAQKMIDFWSK